MDQPKVSELIASAKRMAHRPTARGFVEVHTDFLIEVADALAAPTSERVQAVEEAPITESMRLAAEQLLKLYPVLPPLVKSLLDKVAAR